MRFYSLIFLYDSYALKITFFILLVGFELITIKTKSCSIISVRRGVDSPKKTQSNQKAPERTKMDFYLYDQSVCSKI